MKKHYCSKCGKYISRKNGRRTENEHSLSPLYYFCKCGNSISMEDTKIWKQFNKSNGGKND